MDLTLEKESEKINKTVRISSNIQEIELSPELKTFNHINNFSNSERLKTINSIYTDDKEFHDYLVTRRKGISVKEYRFRILNLLETREKMLNEIRNLNTPNHIKPRVKTIFFFKTPFFHKKTKTYYKSFHYPI
jgi:hypothetical protein